MIYCMFKPSFCTPDDGIVGSSHSMFHSTFHFIVHSIPQSVSHYHPIIIIYIHARETTVCFTNNCNWLLVFSHGSALVNCKTLQSLETISFSCILYILYHSGGVYPHFHMAMQNQFGVFTCTLKTVSIPLWACPKLVYINLLQSRFMQTGINHFRGT